MQSPSSPGPRPSTQRTAFLVEQLEQASVVRVRGEIDLFEADAFERVAFTCPAERRIAVDLTDCTYIDSSGLRVLVRLYKQRRDELTIVLPHRARIRPIFRLTGLDRLLPLLSVV